MQHRKRRYPIAHHSLFLVILAFFAAPLPARQPSLSVGALREWAICVSTTPIPSETYAAQEFQHYFQRTTGILLPIHQGPQKAVGHIFIGRSAALRSSTLGFTMKREYAPEELRIVIGAKNIAILGGRPRGTLYGVYTFVEDYLGIRFLTAKVTHIPLVPATHLLPVVDRSYAPPFAYRHYSKNEIAKDPAFAARRRQNTASQYAPQSQRMGPHLGGEARGGVFLHNNFLFQLPFRDHPECYALIDGQRSGLQPCLTHPLVHRTVAAQLLQNLDGFAPGTTIPLAQNDNGGVCSCTRCIAVQREGDAPEDIPVVEKPLGVDPSKVVDGPPSAVILNFVNRVAADIAKKRPDLWVGTEAYAFSMMPPRNTRALPNVKVQVATYHCSILYGLNDTRSPDNVEFGKYLAGWRKACDHLLIWHYDMNPREYWLPFPNLRAQSDNFRTFARNNGRGIFMQGCAENTELSDLRVYVMTALIWDPSREIDPLIDEFLALYYQQAAPPIRRWIDLFQDQALASGKLSNINSPARGYGLDAPLGEKGVRLFEQAMALADTPELKRRVEKISVTALRLAVEPIWWNAIEAPRRARILKTTLAEERVSLTPDELQRYRKMARGLFALATKHGMAMYYEGGKLERARNEIRAYYGLQDGEPL
ncbi:MAG: DUF4838 domain-containing protein [Planctomycetota bacterium]|nr:DUF4838 domain-containing protein [Planctomycetota bacterium]